LRAAGEEKAAEAVETILKYVAASGDVVGRGHGRADPVSKTEPLK